MIKHLNITDPLILCRLFSLFTQWLHHRPRRRRRDPQAGPGPGGGPSPVWIWGGKPSRWLRRQLQRGWSPRRVNAAEAFWVAAHCSCWAVRHVSSSLITSHSQFFSHQLLAIVKSNYNFSMFFLYVSCLCPVSLEMFNVKKKKILEMFAKKKQ